MVVNACYRDVLAWLTKDHNKSVHECMEPRATVIRWLRGGWEEEDGKARKLDAAKMLKLKRIMRAQALRAARERDLRVTSASMPA